MAITAPLLLSLLAVILALALWVVLVYNRYVRGQNLLKEAWAGVDVQLRRRFDLIPNLVEVTKGYAAHESGTLEAVTAARGDLDSAHPTERARAENALTDTLRTLIARVEAYPDLKASEIFLNLQRSLVEVEDQIQYARRYYNGAARDLNILVQSFPANMLAGALHFTQAPYLEIALATQRDAPDVDFTPGAGGPA
jgi:LemA protein